MRTPHVKRALGMGARPNHAERTAKEPRYGQMEKVRVASIQVENAARTVKSFRFALIDPANQFRFQAGQWLDVLIPKQDIIGGFSLISAPQEVQSSSSFELAIKNATHPPARWFHQEASIGQELSVRVGGSFVYPPASAAALEHDRIVFVAAGVGINPPLSMLEYLKRLDGGPTCTLLYASKMDEVLFLDRLQACMSVDQIQLFITQPSSSDTRLPPAFRKVLHRRFNVHDVERSIGDPSKTLVYLCGPPGMTDEFETQLCGKEGILDRSRLFFERWW